MSKFKVGDKVRLRQGAGVTKGDTYTVRSTSGSEIIYLEGYGIEYFSGNFELVASPPDYPSSDHHQPYDLKKEPWYIDTKGKDSQTIQQWLFDKGVRWVAVGGGVQRHHDRYLTNVLQPMGCATDTIMHSCNPHPAAAEIKIELESVLTFNVKSVVFPRTRRDELNEIIRKAQEELDNLNN